MSTKAQVQTQAKTTDASGPAHTRQLPVTLPEHEAERPDIATQLEGASRLGHSLGAISVRSPAPSLIQAEPLVQRQELPEEEEEELQTKPADGVQRQGRGDGFRLDDETAGRINRARGGGQPLEGAIRARMGETMGHDFSGLRVHTDAEADALNRQLGAKAFTTGRDVFFRRGAYEPSFSSGRELIAHELTHVVQQSSGRVCGGGGMTVRPAGDAFEQEADKAAEVVTRSIHTLVQRQTFEDKELQIQEEAEVIQTNNGDEPLFKYWVYQSYLAEKEAGTTIMTQGADGSCVAIAGKLVSGEVFCAHVDIGFGPTPETGPGEGYSNKVNEVARVKMPEVLKPNSVAECFFVASARNAPTPGLIAAVQELYKAQDKGSVGGLGLDKGGKPEAFDTGTREKDAPAAENLKEKYCTIEE